MSAEIINTRYRILVLVRTIVLGLLGTAILASAAVAGVVAYPEPLYRYHTEVGRLRLYSDRPFDIERGQAVLLSVEGRLGRAPAALRDDGQVYRVFVTNDEWRRRLVFLWSYGAGGVNYYPIAGSVFVRQSDIDTGVVLRSDGKPVEAPRSLAYFAAHEIGHSLIGRQAGAVRNQRMPTWVREGIADYIAFAGDIDIDALYAAYRTGAPDFDPKRSGLYARYRMLVAYFLERQHWPIARLLASDLKLAEADRLMLKGMPD